MNKHKHITANRKLSKVKSNIIKSSYLVVPKTEQYGRDYGAYTHVQIAADAVRAFGV